MTVRTRFAPSPTGSLHVGGARTALYCWLHARQNGGQFLLRIEDTDRARSTEESTQGILRDMAWLGLQWDEGPGTTDPNDCGPFFQSQRLELYERYFLELQRQGVAYEAWETPDELKAARDAASARKENFRYRRIHYSAEDLERFRVEGRTSVLRLAAPGHDISVDDVILGTVTIAAEELEDIVIRKRDGFPTYHFAVVVDDHHMNISTILRGSEHLMNTPKHVGLYQALGWDLPRWGHMPLIFNIDGSKMSKRDKAKTARAGARDASKARAVETGGNPKDYAWLAEATGVDADELDRFMAKKSDAIPVAEAIAAALSIPLPLIEVMDFRKGGYLPEALLNYLALLGWSPGDDREVLPLPELLDAFSLHRVNKTPARFDPDKLKWMNAEYIRASSLDDLDTALLDWFTVVSSPLSEIPAERRRKLLAMYQPRIQTLADLQVQSALFFERPSTWNEKAVQKNLRKGGGTERLAKAADALAALGDWTIDSINGCIDTLAAAEETKAGRFAQPIRVAVAGGPVSPPIGDTLAFLGQDETLTRIHACLDHLQAA